MIKSSNPVLSERAFKKLSHAQGETMTVGGAVNKTLLLLLFVFVGASWSWSKVFGVWEPNIPQVQNIAIWSSVVALALAILTSLRMQWSPVTAPLYALIEGVAVGGASALMELIFPDIVIQAVGLTFGVALVMFSTYRLGLIRATEKFKMGVTSATGAICLIYLTTWILGFFDIQIPYIHQGGVIGIGFSLFVVVIAALNLILDFDFIEQNAQAGMPKFMEWYSAFGLMVTLVWLYLEILNLLAKARSRD